MIFTPYVHFTRDDFWKLYHPDKAYPVFPFQGPNYYVLSRHLGLFYGKMRGSQWLPLNATVPGQTMIRFLRDLLSTRILPDGTAQDITSQQERQLALEQLVQERTEQLAVANEELAANNKELEATNEEYAAINEELEEANGLLVRSNENLQQFAYVASHDLQEPLRKIEKFGVLLKTRQDSLSVDELVYIERMQSAASRISTLIRDLLNFAHISTQRDSTVPIPLNPVVEQVLNTLKLTLAQTKADVKVDPLPIIEGDASRLAQLFQNLLSNALKFRQATVSPRIQINAYTLDAQALPVSVKPSRVAKAYYET